MKKNLKRNIVAALFFAMPALMTSPAFAGTADPVAVVKFVGYKNSQPVYTMNIENPGNEKLTILIKDEEGVVIHEEVVKGTNITKTFQVNREELGKNTISFEVVRFADPVVTKVKIQGDL
jgi:hypothetical protein